MGMYLSALEAPRLLDSHRIQDHQEWTRLWCSITLNVSVKHCIFGYFVRDFVRKTVAFGGPADTLRVVDHDHGAQFRWYFVQWQSGHH